MTTGTKARGAAPAPPRHAAPVDPRIRARRIEVRRDEGRRRRQRLIVVVVVVALVGLSLGLTRSPALDVDHRETIGAVHTSRAQLLAAAGIRRGEPLTDVDVAAAAKRIRALPWVDRATVERAWPGTIRIRVTERVAVAQVRSGAGWAEVDAHGRVLSGLGRPRAGLVTLTGVTAGLPASNVAAAAGPALRLAAALPARGGHAVATITSRRDELSLTLVGSAIVVRVGPPTQLADKLESMEALLASAPSTPPIRTIDVLVPSAPVLTRAPHPGVDPALTGDPGGA